MHVNSDETNPLPSRLLYIEFLSISLKFTTCWNDHHRSLWLNSCLTSDTVLPRKEE